MFEALVTPITMKELIAQGFLTPFLLLRPSAPLNNDQIAARPVDAYRENALGRKAIVFALHTKAAREFTDAFLAEGIPAAMVWGNMPASDRRQTLERYKNGDITVLVNCGVLTEGFDDRPTSCVILARSVGSIGLYLQMVGRGLRTCQDKTDCIIIDLHGSSHVHGAPDEDREWQLEGDGLKKSNLEPPVERFCAVCGVLVEGDADVCPGCGIAKPELTSPEVVGVKLVKYAWKQKDSPQKRAESLKRWVDDAKAANHKIGKAFYKYKAVYGQFPPPEIKRLMAQLTTGKID